MKLFARTVQQNLLHFVALACLFSGAPAFAVSPSEFQRILINQGEHGLCCSSWGESVQVTEPAAPKPVVITWNTDFVNSNPEHWQVGLIVNNGPCKFYGSHDLTNNWGTLLANGVFQWVVFPQDGLVAGTNTFTLCGGSTTSSTDSIGLGFNTLAARVVGISPSQLQRVMVNQVFTGKCCFSWNEKVQINEPTTLVPIVVTWSFDFSSNSNASLAGVSINGGRCLVVWMMGPALSLGTTGEFAAYPSDGLVPGKNTITLCGGDNTGGSGSITIGPNTLAVRITN